MSHHNLHALPQISANQHPPANLYQSQLLEPSIELPNLVRPSGAHHPHATSVSLSLCLSVFPFLFLPLNISLKTCFVCQQQLPDALSVYAVASDVSLRIAQTLGPRCIDLPDNQDSVAFAEFLKRVPSRSLGTPSKMFWVPNTNHKIAYSFRTRAEGLHELQWLHRAFSNRIIRNVPRQACGIVVGPQGATARSIERESKGIVMVSENIRVGDDMRQVWIVTLNEADLEGARARVDSLLATAISGGSVGNGTSYGHFSQGRGGVAHQMAPAGQATPDRVVMLSSSQLTEEVSTVLEYAARLSDLGPMSFKWSKDGIYTRSENLASAWQEYQQWQLLVARRTIMHLPAGLVGYRLVGTKGSNIVPIARDSSAIVIIIPVRGPPKEIWVVGNPSAQQAAIPRLEALVRLQSPNYRFSDGTESRSSSASSSGRASLRSSRSVRSPRSDFIFRTAEKVDAELRHMIRVIPISVFENEWKPIVVDDAGNLIARTDTQHANAIFNHLSHLFRTRMIIRLPSTVEAPRIIGHAGRNLKEVFSRTGAVATVFPNKPQPGVTQRLWLIGDPAQQMSAKQQVESIAGQALDEFIESSPQAEPQAMMAAALAAAGAAASHGIYDTRLLNAGPALPSSRRASASSAHSSASGSRSVPPVDVVHRFSDLSLGGAGNASAGGSFDFGGEGLLYGAQLEYPGSRDDVFQSPPLASPLPDANGLSGAASGFSTGAPPSRSDSLSSQNNSCASSPGHHTSLMNQMSALPRAGRVPTPRAKEMARLLTQRNGRIAREDGMGNGTDPDLRRGASPIHGLNGLIEPGPQALHCSVQSFNLPTTSPLPWKPDDGQRHSFDIYTIDNHGEKHLYNTFLVNRAALSEIVQTQAASLDIDLVPVDMRMGLMLGEKDVPVVMAEDAALGQATGTSTNSSSVAVLLCPRAKLRELRVYVRELDRQLVLWASASTTVADVMRACLYYTQSVTSVVYIRDVEGLVVRPHVPCHCLPAQVTLQAHLQSSACLVRLGKTGTHSSLVAPDAPVTPATLRACLQHAKLCGKDDLVVVAAPQAQGSTPPSMRDLIGQNFMVTVLEQPTARNFAVTVAINGHAQQSILNLPLHDPVDRLATLATCQIYQRNIPQDQASRARLVDPSSNQVIASLAELSSSKSPPSVTIQLPTPVVLNVPESMPMIVYVHDDTTGVDVRENLPQHLQQCRLLVYPKTGQPDDARPWATSEMYSNMCSDFGVARPDQLQILLRA
ncbi:uncharacterized protein MONBRDRAFT_23129 [Monosiga brevicollis MX1]|uniref:K Homology domain-containing protein n=1 Tax=Monosiga brevicollis TaxID=81824 RepID=A9UR97_MONBE|nr:uncharacterized protein MONBRDRAFT_23129 [Monosiga brevicollis MX1]EDQ91886.1 predicted protein [Monosiga brevicollis MX1]|eukprot:XP_001743172.1 hypothetical protein [Monosiga brevicollis MX1]